MKEYKKILGYVIKSAPKECTFIVFMAVIVGVAEGICTQMNIMLYQAIGDFINGHGDLLALLIPFFITTLLSPHYYLYLPMDEYMRSILMERVQRKLLNSVYLRIYHHDMTDLEDPKRYEQVTKASDELIGRKIRSVVDATIFIPLNLSCFFAVIIVLASHSLWLAGIVMIGLIPTFITKVMQERGYFKLYTDQTKKRQYRDYLWNLLNSYTVNRDRKVFGHGEYLIGEYEKVVEETSKEEWKLEKRNFFRALLADSLQPLSIAIAIILSIYFVFHGKIEISVFAALMAAMISVSETSTGTINQITNLSASIPYLTNFFNFIGKMEEDEEEQEQNLTKNGFSTIEFQDVSFRYPTATRNSLSHVSFCIHGKESLALVGENGSGKSTLIKLLLRLYQPNEGRILLDGVDINDISEEKYYSFFSAVFQDFVKYKFSVRENIAMGDLSRMEDTKAIEIELSKYGLLDKIKELSDGVDTVLGREFGEVDLSGGQWQKLAIARGGFKRCNLIVLDEPTASIDPVTESDIFHQFHEFTKDCCSIIISHRIGAARIASRILVLDHGQLVEDGTHEELMRKGGFYHNLYHLQAKWYEESNCL